METKEQNEDYRARRARGDDNYYNAGPKIPDMLTIYEEEMDDLKANAPSLVSITGLCENNVYILNAKNDSMNSECASPQNKKFLFEKFSQIPTIPYPRCSLSGNDCIKRSILYTDAKPKFDKLPVIHSASSSDVEGCPGDDDNEKTYSVSENDTYTVSDEERSSRKVLEKYADSFDSDSSYYLGISDEDSSNDSKSHSVGKEVVDVVEKVINNYHNLLKNFYDPVNSKSVGKSSSKKYESSEEPGDTKLFTEIILQPPDMFSDPIPASSTESTLPDAPNNTQIDMKTSPSESFSEVFAYERKYNNDELSSDNIFKSKTAMDCAIKSLHRDSADFDGKDGFSDGSTIEADDLESFYSQSDPLNSTLTDDLSRFTGDSDVSSEFKIPRVFVSLTDDSNLDRRDLDHQVVADFESAFGNNCDDEIMFIDADENPDTSLHSYTKVDLVTDPLSSAQQYFSDKTTDSVSETIPTPSPSVKYEFNSSDYAVSSAYSNTNTDDTNGTFDNVDSIRSINNGDQIDSLLFNSWQPTFGGGKNRSSVSSVDEHETDSYNEDFKFTYPKIDENVANGDETVIGEYDEEEKFFQEFSGVPKIENFHYTLENNIPSIFIAENNAVNVEYNLKNDISVVPKIEEGAENLENNFRSILSENLPDEKYAENFDYNFVEFSSSIPETENYENHENSSTEVSRLENRETRDEKNRETISPKSTEKNHVCDLIRENDNYVNPSNIFDKILTSTDSSCESATSICALCAVDHPLYEWMRHLFEQWESRCVEIVLLDGIKGADKLSWNLKSKTGTTDDDDDGIWGKNRLLELRDRRPWSASSECANNAASQGSRAAGNRCDDVDYASNGDDGNNEMRDSMMESASTVLISDGFDGTPNPSSSCAHTVSEARRTTGGAKDKQEVESVTGGRQLSGEDDVPVAEHGIHATAAFVDKSSVENDLDECGCWKSLSNDARSDLRKRRTFPPSSGDIMRSLNSSKLDLTGRVPLSELCVLQARTSCNGRQFAAPFNFVDYASAGGGVCGRDNNNVSDLIDQCVHANSPEPVCGQCGSDLIDENKLKSLCVNNIEAIRKFSEYFKTSLETDSKLRQGIADLNLDTDLTSALFTSQNNTASRVDDDENKEDVTSFIFSESDESVENFTDDMKNKKKSTPNANDNDPNAMESTDAQRPGILKSALKRSKKFYRKKHRVQFDESLNKFFEADYVILVRDEQDFDDEYRCECGNQFCYEGCYYEDEEDDDEIEYENSVDSPRFDFAAAFDPPMEFVDPVTLSPPDGYKDGCCQEASQKVSISTMTSNENQHQKNRQGVEAENWENSPSNEIAAFNEKVKTQDCADDGFTKRDRRNQRYPFHGNDVNAASSQLALFNEQNAQPANGQSRYIVETITMTTVTERRIVRESNDQLKINDVSMMNDRDKLNNGGILKGGKLWRNQETNTDVKRSEAEKDDDKRNVKFIRDDNDEPDNCDRGENEKEFMLTFKLGNRVVPCNSLKPNSAVRQLFPDPRFVNPPTILDLEEDNLGKCEGKYLVTEESLRAFNEVNKRSVFAISGKERYPYKDGNFTVHSDDEDIPQNDLIKKTIERNTLRRSLMRYPRGERKREKKKKIEPSLEERIKQLTCVDDQDYEQVTTRDGKQFDEPIPPRTSPPGEESHETASRCEKTSSVTSTYKKFTDLFARNKSDNQNEHYPYYQPVYHAAQPDLGIDLKLQGGSLISKQTTSVAKSGTNEARKQFLSSLAPLTACVTGHVEPNYGNRETLKLKLPGDRHSITSTASTGTEYSIGDIDDVLTKPEDGKAPQPDVVAGTPSGIDNQDELAMFVQQDASRIERIKKRYSNTPSTVSDDDEHDDYGFSRRPSVRGIKPRFGSTTEILQQMQAQLQQPAPTKAGSHMTWPYYSAECVDKNNAGATSPRNPLPALKEEVSDMKTAEYTAKVVWEKSGTIPRGGIATMQQPLKIDTNNVQMFRLAPSDTITEMAVPYKCEPEPKNDLRRFPPGNIFQMKVSPVSSTQVRLPMTVADGQYAAHPIPVGTTSVIRVGHGQQQTFRVPCPVSGPVQVHLLATHHYENPQIRPSSQPIHFPQQIVVAKGTQTSTISTTSFYQLQTNTQSHYQNTGNIPVTKATEHSAKLIQLNYNAAQHQSPPISSLTSSPTRVKTQNHLTERGIPEGAVSSSPAFIQDCVKPQQPLPIGEASNSTTQTQTKPGSLLYGMKV